MFDLLREMFVVPTDPESVNSRGLFSAELLPFLPRPDSDAEFILVNAALMLSPSELWRDGICSANCSERPRACLKHTTAQLQSIILKCHLISSIGKLFLEHGAILLLFLMPTTTHVSNKSCNWLTDESYGFISYIPFDILPSQSLSKVLNKQKLTQEKQTCTNKLKNGITQTKH